MALGYIVVSSLMVITIFIIIYKKLFGKAMLDLDAKPAVVTGSVNSSFIEPVNEAAWWKKLDSVKQLELAVLLADITLPVWEKFSSSDNAFYKDSASPLLTAIDKNLLSTSLKEVREIAQLLPGSDCHKINDCYNRFVGPVLALQDGDWVPPYAVKKIFLSFYNILKGVTETYTVSYNHNFFAIAIDQLLDCIDITKLYSSDQVNEILLDYTAQL